DAAMSADTARTSSGMDGTGVTVGVMSDSYNCNPGVFVPGNVTATAAQDLASGDVPAVNVLDNGSCPSTDEGRGMVQLVHDVAPGAAQAFHSAFNGQLDFALGMLELRDQGKANVVVDDVIYFAENMFSDGIPAQAADLTVVGNAIFPGHAAYFSSAGN